MSSSTFSFSKQLLAWFDQHGRQNLPWQAPITPYRVWLSEIMLQQTQVDTVIPYFNRFLEHFPTLEQLAQSPQDEVLHLWTGLGYYARARNLHTCAQSIVEQYQGQFPQQLEQLAQLPGIGPSTAAAIASIAFEQPTAILDGNVKRVLARFHAVKGWPGQSQVLKTLWQHAHTHMPAERCRDYTQAIMDLGATVCTRSKPQCEVCPLKAACKALKHDAISCYPGKKPRKVNPTKYCQMLLIQNTEGAIYLEKRPPQGIWGGLWSLPELDPNTDAYTHASTHFGAIQSQHELTVVKHVFSHYTLMIQPQLIIIDTCSHKIADDNHHWYHRSDAAKLGLAAPVKRLLQAHSA